MPIDARQHGYTYQSRTSRQGQPVLGTNHPHGLIEWFGCGEVVEGLLSGNYPGRLRVPMQSAFTESVCSPQRLQQRPGILQVGSVEAFGEPVVERRQKRPGLGSLALLLPEARQAHGGA